MNIDTAYYRHRTCLRFILSFIVWLIPMLAHAQISPQKAERLAWDFLVSRFSDRPLPGLYRTDMPEEYGVHVFNIGEDNGFVLVSKSEGADIPVIGYSTSGRFDYSRMPPALKALLLTLKSNASETAPLLPGTYKTVAPILTTKGLYYHAITDTAATAIPSAFPATPPYPGKALPCSRHLPHAAPTWATPGGATT